VFECDFGTVAEWEPGVETTCDGLDNDCDFAVDEAFGQTSCGIGECETITKNCVAGKLVECVPKEPVAEICDGLDNDCDGAADEEMAPITCGKGVCAVTMSGCVDGKLPKCVPLDIGSDELLDNLDNDCDGKIDEVVSGECETCDQNFNCISVNECLDVLADDPVAMACGAFHKCPFLNLSTGACELVSSGSPTCAPHGPKCVCQKQGGWSCEDEPACPADEYCLAGECYSCLPDSWLCDGPEGGGLWCDIEGTETYAKACSPDATCRRGICLVEPVFAVSGGPLQLADTDRVLQDVTSWSPEGFAVAYRVPLTNPLSLASSRARHFGPDGIEKVQPLTFAASSPGYYPLRFSSCEGETVGGLITWIGLIPGPSKHLTYRLPIPWNFLTARNLDTGFPVGAAVTAPDTAPSSDGKAFLVWNDFGGSGTGPVDILVKQLADSYSGNEPGLPSSNKIATTTLPETSVSASTMLGGGLGICTADDGGLVTVLVAVGGSFGPHPILDGKTHVLGLEPCEATALPTGENHLLVSAWVVGEDDGGPLPILIALELGEAGNEILWKTVVGPPSGGAGEQRAPVDVVATEDWVAAVWEDFPAAEGGGSNVFLSYLDMDGVMQQESIVLSVMPGRRNRVPRIAAMAGNQVVVTWLTNDPDWPDESLWWVVGRVVKLGQADL